MNCPACASPMSPLEFERALMGRASIDFCFACQLIWFDPGESTGLSPGGVIEVFKALDAHRGEARNALPSLLDCPRCAARLALTQDVQRTTHFSYYRCPFGHGRLSPFMQFLREKNFIRPVSGAELASLKAKVRMIQCSNCGAPVDLEHEIACTYCHTPISILDPDAVARTLRELNTEQTRRSSVDVDALADAILQRPPPGPSSKPWTIETYTDRDGSRWVVDLVAIGIGLVAALVR
ncbi:MAG: zf-TFIIB domain-containing protein [Betaproteobacteria bacterium]